MRTRVKICGITNEEDARAAVACGADALGFIRVPGGPRFVPDATLVRIAYASRPFVSKVLVVRTPQEAGDHHATYLQFYEDSGLPAEPGLPPQWRGRGVRVFPIRDAASLHRLETYPHAAQISAFLLDTYHRDKLGGSGETFNWELAVAAKRLTNKPIILAGGLTPENVGEAVAKVRPYAVDVSSGVEAEPGRKDHDKLRRFLQAVREADAALDG